MKMVRPGNKYCLLFYVLLFALSGFAQIQVTLPWSPVVNMNFGKGLANPGPPMQKGKSDFIYSSNLCPAPGYYTVINKPVCSAMPIPKNDAGNIFFNGFPGSPDSGYMMLATYSATNIPKIVFADTVRNLCNNNSYLFWAGIMNATQNFCIYPSFSFRVETVSGQLLQSFPTGNVRGAVPPFDFYGGVFTLPAGIKDVVLKIVTNPSTAVNDECICSFAIDNILLTPVGPGTTIGIPGNADSWVTGACYQSGKPVILNAMFNTSHQSLPWPEYISGAGDNPAFQWQQSTDNGLTWADIPGETGLSLSHVFSIPDTFLIRMRNSALPDIGNPGCSVLSNIIKVEVDGAPSGFAFSSNSPVCTDADLKFKLEGGAAFVVTGPNGFADNSPFPHIFHPTLADSGWYYAEVSTFGGCKTTDSIQVKIDGPHVSSGPDTAICYGRKVQLTASGGNIYAWSPATGLSSASIPNPVATVTSSVVYTVKVTDPSGCSALAHTAIVLKDSLLKAAISGTSLVCPGDMALFIDTSTGKIAEWRWNFGNGQTSFLQSPPGQHYLSGSKSIDYKVQLTVTGIAGCTDTTAYMLKAVNNCYIAIPNAFTPNNDGSNDRLYPLNAYKAKDIEFDIYNRYGQLIFQSKDSKKQWDGTVNGNPQPEAVYVWMLRYTDTETGKKVFQRGTTVLIR